MTDRPGDDDRAATETTSGPSREGAAGLRQRWRRSTGTVRVAIGRVRGRLFGSRPGRTLFSVLGVAVAVALMTTVTGVAIGLTAQPVIHSEDVDYWIVPEGATADSALVEPGGAGLARVHETTAQLTADDRVDYATPVQLQVLHVRAGDAAEYVLAVGIVPSEGDRTVAGLPTGSLTPADPHYANGSYDGPWTGEAVVSEPAANLLGVERGASLEVATGDANRSFSAVDVAEGGVETGAGTVPVMVVHLAELQSVTATTEYDEADQILVSTTDPGVKPALSELYPQTSVISRAGFSGGDLGPDDMSLAVGLSAFVVAVAIGTLFVATMMGLEVTADRRRLATLATIGVSGRTRGLIVAVETVAVAFVGGLAGLALGRLGVAGVNAAAEALVGVGGIATFPWWLLAYGLGVAVLIGLLAAPYPVWLSRSAGDVTEVLR